MSDSIMDNSSDGAVATASGFKKNGTSSGILSRFAFMRPPPEGHGRADHSDENRPSKPASVAAAQQQKAKRRKGSLRKAVLGREAQRDKRDAKPLTINTNHGPQLHHQLSGTSGASIANAASDSDHASESSDVTPWPALDDPPSGGSNEDDSMPTDAATPLILPVQVQPGLVTSPTVSYKSTSTTDEEDALHMPQPSSPLHRPSILSSSTESYFGRRSVSGGRRTSQVAKSPLSYAEVGLSTTSIQSTEADWDYTETESWGWVVLIATWFIFVTGMGSCFGVWSWAWDVGTTPYAPPELEDDETLPIVGYYPALLILTGVMAWIWVMVAWVGMKYFRHAKITGD